MWLSYGSDVSHGLRLQPSPGYLSVTVCSKFQKTPLDTLTGKHRVMSILFGILLMLTLYHELHPRAHSGKY